MKKMLLIPSHSLIYGKDKGTCYCNRSCSVRLHIFGSFFLSTILISIIFVQYLSIVVGFKTILFVFKSLCNDDIQCMYFKPSVISWQILSRSLTEMIPSALALYTVNTLQSLPPARIFITKDVLFKTPYTYERLKTF